MTRLLERDTTNNIDAIVAAVTLLETTDPSNVANTGFLYTKDDGGDTELFYIDDGGAVVQITADGAVIVAAHAATHITGGGDEIDGDKLDIDWTPSNYTPTTGPSEADSLDNLTAHLAGIDAALLAAGGDHAADHITGGGDEIDGDKLDIDWDPTNYVPTTDPSEADNLDNLTAHLAGIDAALPTASGQGSYIFATLSADQTTNLTDGDQVRWNTDDSSAGSDIDLDIAVEIGRFTLAAGKTYKCTAMVQSEFSASGGDLTLRWHNITAVADFGKQHTAVPMSSTSLFNFASPVVAYITPTVETTIELQVDGAPTSLNGVESDTSWCTIEVVHGNGLFAGGHVFATLGSAQASPAAAAAIAYDTVENSSGDNISLDVTTNVGRFTLTGGRNYKIQAQVDVTFLSNVDDTATIDLFDVTGAAVESDNGARLLSGGYTTDGAAQYGLLTWYVSPTANNDYEIRIDHTSSVSSINNTHGTYLSIQDLAEPLEEKSITFSTMSVTQTTGLSAGNPVLFDQDDFTQGQTIGSINSNSWVLTAGRTYELTAQLACNLGGGGGFNSLAITWYDLTGAVELGKDAAYRAVDDTLSDHTNSICKAFFTPSVDSTVEVRIAGTEGTPTNIFENKSWAQLETVDGVAGGGVNHAITHITGGNDEIDGDKLDIDWTPSNYVPTVSPSEVDDLDNLTAHLAGIDAALVAAVKTLTMTNDNAGAATQGMGVYISSDTSFDLADADAVATARIFGIVEDASIASSATGEIIYDGLAVIPNARQSAETWAAGERIYVSATAGDLTNVAPSAGGTFIAQVGICVNTPGGGDASIVLIREPLIAN